MPTKQRAQGRPNDSDTHASFAQERIPFDVVMRKLAHTKPPHKPVKPAKTPQAGKPKPVAPVKS